MPNDPLVSVRGERAQFPLLVRAAWRYFVTGKQLHGPGDNATLFHHATVDYRARPYIRLTRRRWERLVRRHAAITAPAGLLAAAPWEGLWPVAVYEAGLATATTAYGVVRARQALIGRSRNKAYIDPAARALYSLTGQRYDRRLGRQHILATPEWQPGDPIKIMLPNDAPLTAAKEKQLVRALGGRLGIAGAKGSWKRDAAQVTVEISGTPLPPDEIDMDALMRAVEAAPLERPVIGWGPEGPVHIDYVQDSPHVALSGAAGCLAGESLLWDPIAQTGRRIDELCARGERPWVLTLAGPVRAEVPFLKGVARLYRVTLQDGTSCTATADHLFLTAAGWARTDSLAPGTELLSGSPAGVHRCSGTRASSPDGCRQCHRLCDPQLPAGSMADLASVLPQSGARGLGRAGSPQGVPASTRARILSCPPGARPSRQRSGVHLFGEPSPERAPATRGGGYHSGSDTPVRALAWCRPLRRSRPGSRPLLPSTSPSRGSARTLMAADPAAVPAARRSPGAGGTPSSTRGWSRRLRLSARESTLRPPSGRSCSVVPQGPHASSCTHSRSQLTPVKDISYVRTDAYYDLHVPGEEHYLADGIWSHNTGKTTLLRFLLAQRMSHGVGVIFLDAKRWSHRWAHNLPDDRAQYWYRVPDMHNALVALGDELQRRINCDESELGTFRTLDVVVEEINSLIKMLTAYWRGERKRIMNEAKACQKEDMDYDEEDLDPPALSPAVAALQFAVNMGRELQIHIHVAAQRLEANVFGSNSGAAVRQSFGLKLMAKWDLNLWKMLASGHEYVAWPGGKRGLWGFVQDSDFVIVRVPDMAMATCLAMATGGQDPSGPVLGQQRVAAEVGQDSGQKAGQIEGGQRLATILGQLPGQDGPDALSLEGLRSASKRPGFPPAIGRDGVAKLYDVEHVIAWREQALGR
jgi:hypothetical protein